MRTALKKSRLAQAFFFYSPETKVDDIKRNKKECHSFFSSTLFSSLNAILALLFFFRCLEGFKGL